MGDASGSVVRRFLEAWADPKADELRGFLRDDAVCWTVLRACGAART